MGDMLLHGFWQDRGHAPAGTFPCLAVSVKSTEYGSHRQVDARWSRSSLVVLVHHFL